MKKLLYQIDTDVHPAVFDNVVAYDGGADHVIGYGGVTPENVGPLVDGAIFTRAPKDKKNTAIFIGGCNIAASEALLKSVKRKFFANFRVSVMLDSNGSNTTARCVGASRLIRSSRVVVNPKAALVLNPLLFTRGARSIIREDVTAAAGGANVCGDRFGVRVVIEVRRDATPDPEPLSGGTREAVALAELLHAPTIQSGPNPAVAVAGWSPVTMITRMPAARQSATESLTSSRGGSIRPTRPRKVSP